jgi:transposase
MENLIKASAVLADTSYDADERVRHTLHEKDCQPVIPPKRNRLVPARYDKNLYKSRHLIENFFAKLKQYRTFATRHEIKITWDENIINYVYHKDL